MAISGGGDGGYASEINITPLVDVVLVLLIIFMMIVPIMMRGYDVSVPGEKAAAPAQAERPEQIVLQIELATCPVVDPPSSPGLPSGCTVHLNDDAVPVGELAGRVGEILGDRQAADRVLFIAAHDRLNYEGVMRILDSARSGVDDLKIGLVTEADTAYAPQRGAELVARQ